MTKRGDMRGNPYSDLKKAQAAEKVSEALELLGFDTGQESIKDTPMRWVKALHEMCEGYGHSPELILERTFSDSYDQIVALANIPFVSLCEHHLLPFSGRAGVAYLPKDGKVVGLSKLARVVECFARRLQMQERLTQQVANAVFTHLGSSGVAVAIEAEHSCIACRGIRKPGTVMRTSALRGVFKEDTAAKDEALRMLR